MATASRTILIVGASRGIGLGLAQRHLERGWTVIATARDDAAGLVAIEQARLLIERLDMTVTDTIGALAARLDGVRLDRLLVNAGISGGPSRPAAELDDGAFASLMLCNALGPIRVIARLRPRVPPGGLIAALSSSVGSVANNARGGFDAYRASKAALNMLLRSEAARDGGRSYLAIDPGWVRTDMGGADAPITVQQSTAGIADLLDARERQPPGGSAFLDWQGGTLPW